MEKVHVVRNPQCKSWQYYCGCTCVSITWQESQLRSQQFDKAQCSNK
jgi:hypothetical protein